MIVDKQIKELNERISGLEEQLINDELRRIKRINILITLLVTFVAINMIIFFLMIYLQN